MVPRFSVALGVTWASLELPPLVLEGVSQGEVSEGSPQIGSS